MSSSPDLPPSEAIEAAPDGPLPPRLVFYDGECGFCDNTVQWLLERDPEARLRFAPLQGPTAASVRRAHPEIFPADLDTLVVVDSTGAAPKLQLRSAAIVTILDWLDAWPPATALLRWLAVSLPRAIPDFAYRLFAANRIRLFGRLESCRIPSPGERERFLD